MRRIGIFALLLLLALPISAQTIRKPHGLSGKIWNSTLALYGTLSTRTHFDCTAEPIAKIGGGYRILTAGHCVQDVPAGIQFSVAEEIGGPLTPVTLVKAYEGTGADPIDFALFDLKTKKKYHVLALGIDDILAVGEPTVNFHFAMGLGKQVSKGVVTSQTLQSSEDCKENGCVQNYIVQEYSGPGASGSAVLSAKTHRVIGILVYETDGPIGFVVEPIARFQKFLDGPNQPHPAPLVESDEL